MANQIPFSGASDAAGGYVLPTEQGDLLTTGLLQEGGALNLAGDRRATSSRKTEFGIWLGAPTAEIVGEGAPKPATGGEFGQGTLNVKKIASILLFTDEQREDALNGDLDVLVDSGVRGAIADVIDANIIGKDSGTNISGAFDNMWRSANDGVEWAAATPDGLRLAVSAAMGKLEANGYRNQSNMGVLLAADASKHLRDARAAVETTTAIYDTADPLYGLQREFSSNLNTLGESAGANKIVGFVVYKPNVHVRIRKDVTLSTSNSATVNDGSTDRHLFQENLTALRYETRIGAYTHDLNRSVIPILNAS